MSRPRPHRKELGLQIRVPHVWKPGTPEWVTAEMRCRSLWSPYYFGKAILGHRDMVPHLHQHDTELVVQRMLEGVLLQGVEWPRGFLKTSSFTIGTGMWVTLPPAQQDLDFAVAHLGYSEGEWLRRMSLHDQNATQVYAFETLDNACRKIKVVRLHYEGNELLRMCFPEVAYEGKETPWNDKAVRLRRAKRGPIDGEASFQAIGVGGALQSQHYDWFWLDDIVGEAAANSRTEMDATKGWFGRITGVEQLKPTRWFLVSNRWGYDDINSFARDSGTGWVFYTRAAWEIDPQTGREVAIWPEVYPMERLLEKRSKMSERDFCAHYLNAPRPPGEEAVDSSQLHYYQVDPAGKMVCACGATWHPNNLFRVMQYDPYNAKGRASTSSPAIAVVGLSADRHVFLLDYFLQRGDYSKMYDQLFRMNDQWQPHLFTYEDVGAQNMTEFYLRQAQRQEGQGHRMFPRIRPVPTRGKPKEIRIRDYLFPVIEGRNGRFACRRTHLQFLEMLKTFPAAVPGHDYDLLDALAQGPAKDKDNRMIWRFPAAEAGDEEESQDPVNDAYLAGLGKPYGVQEPAGL